MIDCGKLFTNSRPLLCAVPLQIYESDCLSHRRLFVERPRVWTCWPQKEKNSKQTYTKMDLSLPILLSLKMSLRLRLITFTALFLNNRGKKYKRNRKKKLKDKIRQDILWFLLLSWGNCRTEQEFGKQNLHQTEASSKYSDKTGEISSAFIHLHTYCHTSLFKLGFW